MPTVPEQTERYSSTMTRMMCRLFLLAFTTLASAALFTIAPGAYAGDDRNDEDHEGRHERAYAIGLWGDLPYSSLQALSAFRI